MITRRDLANALRFLSIDAVQQAKSGHPGMPMGMADIAQVLWNDFLQHNPTHPEWWNRDRFVLSNGHGSMLLYSLLHLSGYDLQLEDLKQFRQLHSRTPGHPEVGITPGVEVTTGPLGQGLACAVGFALAEKLLATEFNRPEHNIIDHYTYCFVGDGCLMEGISHEVGSLAGTLKLNKLIVFWDDNGISIDGKVSNWFNDNTAQRFAAYGWHVIEDIDGHNPETIKSAIAAARQQQQPTLICCKTQIGYGSPNLAGSEKAHGAPLGEQEIAATRAQLNWQHPPFFIPQEIYASWNACAKGQELEQVWRAKWQHYKQAFPELAAELQRRMDQRLPHAWQQTMQDVINNTQESMTATATRKASQDVLADIAEQLPELLGGSADLSHSNLTIHKHSKPILPQAAAGNYVYYGVREFGMAAIMNGLALHGGFIPYGGTFLTFVDYARNAIRMSGLMRQRVIYVLTHDSIGLGEDGPTHQPIEHLTMLRVTPNVTVWRPADAVETAVAWQSAVENLSGPTCLALSRQKLLAYNRTPATLRNVARGGYILLDSVKQPNALLIATGSEVEIAMAAAEQLNRTGLKIRVISMPCAEVFLQQDAAYRAQVLPSNITARVAIEAGAPHYWYQFVGDRGKVIGLHTYGESAPDRDVYAALGITVQAVIDAVQSMVNTHMHAVAN